MGLTPEQEFLVNRGMKYTIKDIDYKGGKVFITATVENPKK